MAKVYAIILSGGKGSRLDKSTPKQFLHLKDKPLIAWSLETFNAIEAVDNILIVMASDYFTETEKIVSDYNINKFLHLVPGGKTRQESSWNALNAVDFSDDDILIFHDAARPFVTKTIITDTLWAVKNDGAAGVYVKTIDTITSIESDYVESITPRKKLYNTQTPQGFSYKIISDSHTRGREKENIIATDDISLAIDAGYRVKKVQGEYTNIKITTPFDYEIAEFLSSRIKNLI